MHTERVWKEKKLWTLFATGMLAAVCAKEQSLFLLDDKMKGVHFAEEWINGTVISCVQKKTFTSNVTASLIREQLK